ncbi:transcriptional regulator [Kribbella sp. NPDC051952]|uniref:transcriptional regulator n=1 Tax=Kribbella sp. NPDC051952 TaxID=3154851 RepID=UPI0034369FE7
MTRPILLALHGVRLTGFAETPVVARRFGLAAEQIDELLRDAQSQGWVEYSTFAGTSGWSLTEEGRQQNEHLLAAEVAGAADAVRAVYQDFLPLNALLQRACTDWQLRPTSTEPLAANDHSDPEWDAGVLHELAVIDRALGPLAARLAGILPRFRGYDTRFTAALARATAGETAWVDRSDVDSCHRVWFELHEDLLATLNLHRGD